MLQCATEIATKEGVLALWRGIGPALFSTGLTGSIRFGCQSAANKQLAHCMGVKRFSELTLGQRVLFEGAGEGYTGLVLPFVFTPIELIKVRQQARQGERQLSSRQILREAVK